MNEWRCDEWGGIDNDRDGCIRTRQVPVNEKRGLSLHAQRPQQRSTSPSIDRAAKQTWFNEARAPCPPRPIFKSIFLAALNSTVVGSFVCLPYLRESLLEPAGSLTTGHTPIQIYFGARMFAKGKPLKLGPDVCVRKSHTHYLFSD